MDEKSTIAVCDILGFSEIVMNRPVSATVDTYVGWLRKALLHSMNKSEFPEEVPSLRSLQMHEELGMAWFSDTILLYTLKDTDECIQALVSTVGWFLFEGIFSSCNLRCGLAYGLAHLDSSESIYVGRPIVEAYRLEQVQAWAGGALAPSLIDRLPEVAKLGHYADWWLVPYDVPRSDGGIASDLAINWTWGIHPRGCSIDWSSSSPEPSQEDRKSRPRVVEKWENTKEFHRRVCSYCKPLS